MNQGQRLNLKYTIGDVDLIVGLAKAGRTAFDISKRLKGTALASTPQEIVNLCWQAGQVVRLKRHRRRRVETLRLSKSA